MVLFAWLAAAASAAAEPASLKSLQELARRGRYETCRTQAEAALAEHPNDPWLTLYRNLCAERLGVASEFPPMFSEQLHQRMEELKREERAQQRHAVQQKALDRELKQEQKRWDREVQSLARDVERERLRDAREAEQAEARRRRLSRHEPRPSPAPLPEPVPSEPALPPQTSQVRPGERRVTEPEPGEPDGSPIAEAPPTGAAPPVEPQTGAAPVHVEIPTPSLVGKPKPPAGAVQINARQMGMSPDSKVATAEGDVELVYGEAFLTCDRMTLFTDTHNVYAEGHVRLEQGAQVFRGEMVQYNFDTKKGRFLQGTVSNPPWVEHGRALEHIAEGVYEVTPGYLTTCEFEPPHFRLAGRRALVFAEDRHARASNVALIVEQLPFLYLPFVSFTEHKSPFFIIPGKRKPWGAFALGGYRYELPGDDGHEGAARLDWRQNYGWGYGVDHRFESADYGKGLLKAYYNPDGDKTEENPSALPKGADKKRYRLLWRHAWRPAEHTSIMTDVQEFSDEAFRKDFLYHEEYLDDDQAESYISSVTSTPDFSLTGLVRKRMNRFQTVNEALPQMTLDLRERSIYDSNLYTRTAFDVANFQTKRRHSDDDTDVVRGSLLQQFKYAVRWFSPLEVTPNIGTRQTYYTKDAQGSTREGERNVIVGQFLTGVDSSIKFSRTFPVTTNAWGLNINRLRHLVAPTVSYAYRHDPTVLNDQLSFPAADAPTNVMSLGVENKLQTKRLDNQGRWQSTDLVRLLTQLPYTFHGAGNEQGARFGNWVFDLESVPWPWLRLESDLSVPSHFDRRTHDSRVASWATDLVVVGGVEAPTVETAHDLVAPAPVGFRPGPVGGISFMPRGQWYLGAGHRYSRYDKPESVLQWDWRVSEKWQIGSFHRYTFKEVVSSQKRFNNLREIQYNLRRDLHDWVAELVYRVDREYGEEVFLTLTLKAFPEMPFETDTAYHQPKIGSQSSVFSPVR